jgi:REP-associated tyrosine transposase
MLARCPEIMAKVCADIEAQLVQLHGEHDHMHLLVHYPPKLGLSKLLTSLDRRLLPAATRPVR